MPGGSRPGAAQAQGRKEMVADGSSRAETLTDFHNNSKRVFLGSSNIPRAQAHVNEKLDKKVETISFRLVLV